MQVKNLSILIAIGCIMLVPHGVFAHCDTLDGPVVRDAKTALGKSDVTPVLKWVKKDAEPEVRTAFDKALVDRRTNKKTADLKFFETLVKMHRAGEGEDFTGLKPVGAVEPSVAKADEAIEKGSVDELAKKISDMVSNGIKERFEAVIKTKKHMDESVEAGREYVNAYVGFVHYVEELHNLASDSPVHKEH